MHCLDFSSYPVRWRRLLRVSTLLVIVIAIEGMVTLLWLLARPSEMGSRFFLAYSLQRWIMILLTALIIFLFVYILWAIKNKQEWVLKVIEYFEDKKRAAGLLIISSIIFAVTLGVRVGLLSNEGMQSYYVGLLPILLFVTLTVAQLWIFLLVCLRQARTQILNAWFLVYQEDQFHFKATNRYLLVTLLFISLFYLIAQVGAGIRVPKAVALGDTTSYLEGAGMQLSDPAFFSERRPWGILLIYKLLGGSLSAIGIAQLMVSTLAWLSLVWVLVGSLRTTTGKLLGFVFTLGVSLSPMVQVWNHAGLSESLSISMMVLILGLLIGLLQRWRWAFFLALIFTFAVWVSIHEVNLYLGLLAAITLFIFGLVRKHYRTFLVLSFSIAVILVINSHLSSLYGLPRWALPVAEVLTKRILPVPEYLDYFSSQGMPVTPELMALSGRWAHSDNFAILNNLKLRKFSNWLFKDGRTIYAKFLVAHPIYTLTMPLLNIHDMLAVDFSNLIPGYEPALPVIANELFFPIGWFWIFLAISVLLFGFILWNSRLEGSRVFWLIVLFFVFSIPYLYLAWHGDALDLERHAAIVNIQFHLGIWLLLIFYLDKRTMTRAGVQL